MGRKQKKVFWLSESPTSTEKKRALSLVDAGFDVIFFRGVQEMLMKLDTQRASIFVIDDRGNDSQIFRNITLLSNHPTVQGARLIFSTSRSHELISFRAAAGAFRDIIPNQLDDQQWLTRFLYATSGKAIEWPIKNFSVSTNSIAAVTLPARINWLSNDEIQVESKLKPTVGSRIQIAGKVFDNHQRNMVTVEVRTTNNSNLRYRFSNSFTAKLLGDSNILQSSLQSDEGASALGQKKPKIFAICTSSDLRRKLLDELDSQQFQINFALQKHSMVYEPQFFKPDIVILEDKLCHGAYESRFAKMLNHLLEETPILVIGTDVKQSKLKAFAPRRDIHLFSKLPKDFSSVLKKSYLRQLQIHQAADVDRHYIDSQHEYSYGSIHIPARLHSIHPEFAKLVVSHELSNFGLCRIESPLLKAPLNRSPFAKIVKSNASNGESEPKFHHEIGCILSDLSRIEKDLLARHIVESIAEDYGTTKDLTRLSNPAAQPVVHELPKKEAIATPSQIEEFREYTETPARKRTTPAATTPLAEIIKALRDVFFSPTFRLLVGYVGFLAFALSILYVVINYVSEHYEQSGGQYTESLKKFAPRKFEGE